MSFAQDDPRDGPETVVEGDAVELPGYPVDAQSAGGAPVTPVYEAEPFEARAYASAAGPTGGPTGAAKSPRGWPDAGVDLAERPEYVVAAAFGGGLLLALILRKLGN